MKRFFQALAEYAFLTGLVLLIAAIVAGVVWADFKIWSLQHPGAPAWTFIFK